MESNLKIDYEFISTWHPKYDQIANDENEYKNLVALVNKEIGQKATISKETFIRILNWKSPRLKGKVKLNEFGAYERGISAAYSAEENQKLRILLRLHGIGAPVASTILHFIYPNSYPIIDIRTFETLHHAARIPFSTPASSHYALFRSQMLNIGKENPCSTLREIDRALFAYHKIHLSPKLKSKAERKEIERRTTMPKPKDVLRIKDKVLVVFKNRIGENFGRGEIINLVVSTYPETNRESVIPSDYCYNLVNKDSTSFKLHLFESLGEGRFKCLGENYLYSGPIYWKGKQIGKWEHGKYQLWKDPRK